MKTAIIDVGGGLRGIYAAGVFDYLLENDIHFDILIGVSAGSANTMTYMARQEGRLYDFYTKYSTRPEYMSVHNFLKSGSYIDMDYIYGTLSNSDGEYPIDYETCLKSDSDLYVVATNAITGRPVYFTMDDMDQDQYNPIKASCSIPVVNKPYVISNIPYFDGALSDPVPIDKAFELGADKVVLILTKPVEFERKAAKDTAIASLMKDYPRAAAGLKNRAAQYNADVKRALELEKEGKLLILSPDSIGQMKTLSRDNKMLHRLYLKGFNDARDIDSFLGLDHTTRVQKRLEEARNEQNLLFAEED